MLVMFKTGTLWLFDSPPYVSGAIVDDLFTAIPLNTNESSLCRGRFFQISSALCLKSSHL